MLTRFDRRSLYLGSQMLGSMEDFSLDTTATDTNDAGYTVAIRTPSLEIQLSKHQSGARSINFQPAVLNYECNIQSLLFAVDCNGNLFLTIVADSERIFAKIVAAFNYHFYLHQDPNRFKASVLLPATSGLSLQSFVCYVITKFIAPVDESIASVFPTTATDRYFDKFEVLAKLKELQPSTTMTQPRFAFTAETAAITPLHRFIAKL
jgi:hypothetical protein